MDSRPLGMTGLNVSPIALGTVKFGRNVGVKYPRPFDLPSDENLAELLTTAADLGINLLDTAPAYGLSEERLGRLLRSWPRGRWLVATKVGEEFDGRTSRFDFTAASTVHSVERSCRRLGVDTLDLVCVHSDGNDAAIIEHAEVIPALHELRQRGLVRAIGFSGKTAAGGLAALECCDVVMVTCNLAEQGEVPVIREAAKRGRGVLIKKALASGHLAFGIGTATGSGVDETPRDPVEAGLRFVLGQRGVSSVVVGTINPEHLRHNVRCAERVLSRKNDQEKNGSAPGDDHH